MHASTDTTPQPRRAANLQTPVYGIHAPGMLAHADRAGGHRWVSSPPGPWPSTPRTRTTSPGGEDTQR